MRRKLGQHFLKDRTTLLKIAEALNLEPGDTVIEIGAGHGELTEKLKAEGLKIIAIERDKDFVELLRNKFGEDKNVEIVEGDALEKLKTKREKLKTYKIVGNIPYYITGHLLRVISELENKPEICVLTIQKEVAIRITAEPPKMNRLAASVQFWAEPKIVDYLQAKLFSPPPEVDSAIVKLKTRSEKRKIKGEDYYRMIRILFQQPRKTILNNLVAKGENGWTREKILEVLEKEGVKPSDRPQNLSIDEIVRLATVLE